MREDMPMDTSDQSLPPDSALQLILTSAAFDDAARAAATWSEPSEQDRAEAMFASLAELFRLELSDPAWSTQAVTREAVALLSRAYAAAASSVRRTDSAPEFGDDEIKQRGCAYAADRLQARADTLALIAVELGERLPKAEHRVSLALIPVGDDGFPAVEFATLVVVQDSQIGVTLHQGAQAAEAYYREHFPGGAPHHHRYRIDVHTVGVQVDDHDRTRDDLEVEITTLTVVQGSQIDVSVHQNGSAAYLDLCERFPEASTPTGQREYAMNSHHLAVSSLHP